MPRISEFYGIVISMYHDESHGLPHFHARYAGSHASIAVDTLEVLRGKLPPVALRLVTKWARLHRDELHENWARARSELPLKRIDPLP